MDKESEQERQDRIARMREARKEALSSIREAKREAKKKGIKVY